MPESMDSHMNFRMSSKDKSIIEAAAKLKGFKPNTYARQKLLEAAERDITEMNQLNTVILSKNDWDLFLEAMKKPIKTNKNLEKTIKKYRKFIE